jgi:hypothetical protein
MCLSHFFFSWHIFHSLGIIIFHYGSYNQIFLALIASSTVLGAATNLTTNWNPNEDGCVDTKGFLSCYDTQVLTGVNCLDNCANDNQEGTTAYKTCVSGCTGHWLASNVGCWLETCWNQVRLLDWF